MAFHPGKKKLVHLEPSLDADAWAVRELRFAKKFEAGRKHIPALFAGIEVPNQIEQIAILVFANTSGRDSLGGGKLIHVSDVLREITEGLNGQRVESSAVPEQFALIRTIQFVTHYRPLIWPVQTQPAARSVSAK